MISKDILSARTAFLAKLIGLYCVLIAILMFANKLAFVDMVTGLVHDAPLSFVFGLTLVGAGLAMILSHNSWSGGALRVIVTLIGWLTLAKGLFFLFMPPPAAVGFFVWGSAYEQYLYLDAGIVFVLGAYLTYGGFKQK